MFVKKLSEVLNQGSFTKQPPQEVIDAAINATKKRCEEFQYECKDFKVLDYKQKLLTDADNANEIKEKWELKIKNIFKFKHMPEMEWRDISFGAVVEIKKTGEISAYSNIDF